MGRRKPRLVLKPQGESIVHSILKDNFAGFYHSFWANCPHENRFRQEFIQEGKRQWGNKESIKEIRLHIFFSTSDNTGAAERFLQYNLEVKLHQENYES